MSNPIKELMKIQCVRNLSDEAWDRGRHFFDPLKCNDDAFKLMVSVGVYVTKTHGFMHVHDTNGCIVYTMGIIGSPTTDQVREAIVAGVLEIYKET